MQTLSLVRQLSKMCCGCLPPYKDHSGLGGVILDGKVCIRNLPVGFSDHSDHWKLVVIVISW